MEQRNQLAGMRDAPTKPSREGFVRSMEQRNQLAVMRDVQMLSNQEEPAQMRLSRKFANKIGG